MLVGLRLVGRAYFEDVGTGVGSVETSPHIQEQDGRLSAART